MSKRESDGDRMKEVAVCGHPEQVFFYSGTFLCAGGVLVHSAYISLFFYFYIVLNKVQLCVIQLFIKNHF
jgi:hypothetical protein